MKKERRTSEISGIFQGYQGNLTIDNPAVHVCGRQKGECIYGRKEQQKIERFI